MTRTLAVAACLFAAAVAGAADAKLTLKIKDDAPPKELGEAVRAVLDGKAMRVFDDKGKLICTVWARKALETKATADQAKSGLKYSHLEETTLVGAVQFPGTFTDYRKYKVQPGVYTLRFGNQPTDGDHQGTAPYNEFCLLTPAGADTSAGTMEAKELFELITKSTKRKHPGVMLLFPNKTPPEK